MTETEQAARVGLAFLAIMLLGALVSSHGQGSPVAEGMKQGTGALGNAVFGTLIFLAVAALVYLSVRQRQG